MAKSLEQRFWSKVDKDGPTMSHMNSNCWVWTGYRQPRGYGSLRVGASTQPAHRVSLSLVRGCMPELNVLHACDNPACVRPDHLREGTQGENLKDAYDRKRRLPPNWTGAAHPHSKLDEDMVREIRARAEAGETRKSISESFPISPKHVGQIVRRQRWAHVA